MEIYHIDHLSCGTKLYISHPRIPRKFLYRKLCFYLELRVIMAPARSVIIQITQNLPPIGTPPISIFLALTGVFILVVMFASYQPFSMNSLEDHQTRPASRRSFRPVSCCHPQITVTETSAV